MTPDFKRRAGLYAVIGLLVASFGILCLWTFSRARTPLGYMVGGTLATAILLALAFVHILRRGFLGRPRR